MMQNFRNLELEDLTFWHKKKERGKMKHTF